MGLFDHKTKKISIHGLFLVLYSDLKRYRCKKGHGVS